MLCRAAQPLTVQAYILWCMGTRFLQIAEADAANAQAQYILKDIECAYLGLREADVYAAAHWRNNRCDSIEAQANPRMSQTNNFYRVHLGTS